MTDKAESQPNPVDEQSPDEVTFHYIKSNHFRVIRADGAYGGVSPRGEILMAIFNERQPIPLQTANAIVDGRLGEEIRKVGRDGIVREVEVGVMMTSATARSLAGWLVTKADTIDQAQKDTSDADG